MIPYFDTTSTILGVYAILSLIAMPITSVFLAYSELPSLSLPQQCHLSANKALPDSKCTPGDINKNVNQNNIKNTICKNGYAKSIRPPISYTAPLKIKLIKSYGYNDTNTKHYELDHLISLEIGGNATSVKNLWPEPQTGKYDFHIKDRFENFLHKKVCQSSIPLSDAQHQISSNWLINWINAGKP